MSNKNKSEFIKPNSQNKDIMEMLLIPVSIVLAGVVIAVSVLYAGSVLLKKDEILTKSNVKSVLAEVLANNGTTVAPTVAATAAAEEFAAAKTSIDTDPYKGDRTKAKVAIVEYSDYECPFCQRHYTQTYDSIVKNYVDTGKVIYVYRDNPLSFHEPAATRAANGMNCALEEGGVSKYFELHNLYFKNTATNGAGLTGGDTKFIELATSIGLNKDTFTTCLNAQKFGDEIKADMAAATQAGASGTPGFIIGVLDANGNVDGKLISGAYPYASFQTIIDEQLAKV